MRMTLDDDREQLCTRTGRKIYSKKHIGNVRCPPAKEACATRTKFPVFPITQAIPDRGPYDGGNFLAIRGNGLLAYSDLENLTITLGDISLSVIEMTNDNILLKIPKVDKKGEIMVAQTLTITHTRFPETNGTFENFYVFTDRSYAAAWSMATPALVVLALTGIIAALI
jgi:hypothetical protein